MKIVFDLEDSGRSDIRLVILDGEDVLWPHPRHGDGSSAFDAQDVLSYLADSWPSLMLTEAWPDIFDSQHAPRSITGLLHAAEDRWDDLPGQDSVLADAEAAEIDAFLYRHDLSSMKHGAALPPFFILRQGHRCRIETGGTVSDSCRFDHVVQQLTKLGMHARARLVHAGAEAEATIARWDARDQPHPTLFAALLTGLRPEILEASPGLVSGMIDPLKHRLLSEVANDNAEPVFAVARSSGRLGPDGLLGAIGILRGLGDGDTTTLSRMQRRVQQDVKAVSGPTNQGIRAASFVRQGFPDTAKFDLDLLSRQLGVTVKRVDTLDSRLDGLASAGPRHGPAIVLNRNTFRRGAGAEDLERSLRFTWAHEIGHLLLDNQEWPAIIDATRQRVPREIETRANAFATYLLLPAQDAYRRFDVLRPAMAWPAMETVLNDLSALFALPRINVARQVLRGAPPERQKDLRAIFETHIERF